MKLKPYEPFDDRPHGGKRISEVFRLMYLHIQEQFKTLHDDIRKHYEDSEPEEMPKTQD